MRLVFMGTPDFAVPTLDALHAAGHDIAAVYTQPPRPAGRGKAPQPSAVQIRAEALGLPVRTPTSLKDEAEQAAFAALDLDAAVVAAYGLILPRAVLNAPASGCLNVHASLLPRWRGAAPVQRAILTGDVMTGVTIMQMAMGLDTGPVLASVETLTGGKTAGQLTDELARLGAEAMIAALPRLDELTPLPQPEHGVTYAAKIGKEEARIDFAAPADAVERQVRAFTPWPGAWCSLGGERVKILAADIEAGQGAPGMVLDDSLLIACGNGALRPTLIQRPGRSPMTTAELLRGFPIAQGSIVQ